MSILSTANKCLIANNLFMGRINYKGSLFEHEKKFFDLSALSDTKFGSALSS